MTLGDRNYSSNGNNTNRQNNGSTYYSNLRIRNYEKKNAIVISYSGGLMKIGIGNEDESHHFDAGDIVASVSPMKAHLLVDAMNAMEADNNENKTYGVSLGFSQTQTAIAFQTVNGNRYLRIAKVDSTNGSITGQRTFEFQKNSNPYLHWSDFDTMKFTKTYDDDAEYYMLKNALKEFADGQSGAYAYGAFYMNRYNESSNMNRINAIMEKLGIPTQRNNPNFQSRDGGFFNNGGTSTHRSINDIEDMLGGNEDDE